MMPKSGMYRRSSRLVQLQSKLTRGKGCVQETTTVGQQGTAKTVLCLDKQLARSESQCCERIQQSS